MSVIKSNRAPGKLEVLNKMHNLCVYTITTCSNVDIFPKRNRWIIASRLINDAIDAETDIAKANDIYPGCEEDWEKRRDLQISAHGHIASMLRLLNIEMDIVDPSVSKKINYKYWVKLIIEAQDGIVAWRRSDTERHKKELVNKE